MYDDEKFAGVYRIESARLKHYDYGSNGGYFVTICTKYMKPYFGEVRCGIMGLSELGCQAWGCWYDIPNHFPFVVLDEFVVMPNHVHGVLFIDKKNGIGPKTVQTQNNGDDDNNRQSVQTQNVGDGDKIHNSVKTQNIASLRNNEMKKFSQSKFNQFGPQSNNLASIIRGFKIGVTKFARQKQIDFHWQPRYHDRIIRNELALNRIRNYIKNNPKKWKEDKFQL